MKKKTKFVALLSCVATFLASVALSVSAYALPAKAEADLSVFNNGTFEMTYGASVKLSSNGLRFRVKMDENCYNQIVDNDHVKIYGFIAPTSEFDKIQATAGMDYEDISIKVGRYLDESLIYKKNGYYYANIALTNLDKYTSGGVHLYQKSFSAMAYVINTDTSELVYADMAKSDVDGKEVSDIENQSRTQYDVLNEAILAVDEKDQEQLMQTYGSWYGVSDETPILVDTVEKYETLVDKLASDGAFAAAIENKKIFINKDVQAKTENYPEDQTIGAYVDTVTDVSAEHVVTFYNGNDVVAKVFVADGENAEPPAEPTRSGYNFAGWSGNYKAVACDENVYAKWMPTMGDEIYLDGMSAYGVQVDGSAITEDNTKEDIIGKKVVLLGGYLGDGAYYPGVTVENGEEIPNPTDKDETAKQSYLAYEGGYGFNDYFVADFTGKNMPALAFFANDYYGSMFFGDGTKRGVVVATGLTLPDGRLFTEDVAYCTSVFNGKGLCMWGPHMIYSTAKNGSSNQSVLIHSNVEDTPLGRANLESDKHYRVIMGFKEGKSATTVILQYCLYDLDNGVVVEMFEQETYGFFTEEYLDGELRDDFCVGSIIAYGYFGTPTVLDKTYDIYEDTTISKIGESLGMDVPSQNNVTVDGDTIVLGAGNLGDGANYTLGQNNGGYVHQAYYALNGSYGLNDYVAFDFTGKNMPEVAFFANNYNDSMYSEGTSKQGIVIVTGITTYDGQLTSGVNSNGTQINVSKLHMIGDATDGGFMQGSFLESALGRANLVDDTRYRVIMGFSEAPTDIELHANKITLHWCLYNLNTNTVVEQNSLNSWHFFTGSNAEYDNLTRDQLSGSIVLYGKFGTTCTIDKLWGVFEDTNIADLAESLSNTTKTIVFKNYDGTVLQESAVEYGEMPEYTGAFPEKPADPLYTSYTFAGWDKEIAVATKDTVYTATFIAGEARDGGVNLNKVTANSGTIVLGKGEIGDGANYTLGQNNGGYVRQAYYALDGSYGLNDYVAFDFTGKNMPEVAFFANNYNDSMYAEGTSKQGIVIVTGITTYDGQLTSGVNNNGTQINYSSYYMIENAANGGFVQGSFPTSALGRANLVEGTRYRVIMGFTEHSEETARITLKWYLYNLDTQAVVEEGSLSSWGFFSGSNASGGNLTRDQLSGSIVLYGKFGVETVLDNVWGVFENTDIATVAAGFNNDKTYTVKFVDGDDNVLQEDTVCYGALPAYLGETPIKVDSYAQYDYVFAGWDKEISPVTKDVVYRAGFTGTFRPNINSSNVTADEKGIVLGAGSIGNGGTYTGPNANDLITQSYIALDGNYSFGDYVALDFTGKNMPEVAFFAKNYNQSMYQQYGGKSGVVVSSGITLWNGSVNGDILNQSTQINISGPYMANMASAATGASGNLIGSFNSQLARANLVDGTRYRVIMGFTKASENAITLNYALYNLDTGALVEDMSQTTWNLFANADFYSEATSTLSGSIVLYGKFSTTCTIDKLWGVFEDTDLATLKERFNTDKEYTVTYENADGETLQKNTYKLGQMPTYKGETPTKASTELYEFTFNGWHKNVSIVNGDITYVASYTETLKAGINTHNATLQNGGEGLRLESSAINDNAHYSGSNNLQGVIGTINQSYLAFDGNYGFNDYVVFDFTGKNMPSVAFFANNYNESMYYQNGDKYGLVVLTGLTDYTGALYKEFNDSKSVYDGTGLIVCGPQMLHNTLNSGKNGVLGFDAVQSNSGSNTNVALGRANLDDGKQYRVIMGMEAPANLPYAVQITYLLYNVTDRTIVEEFSAITYNFFTDGFAKDGQTRDEYCQGSIVLYGHFGTTTMLDKVWGVYENTNVAAVAEQVLPAADSGSEPDEPVSNAPDYSHYTDQFDFYAYSCYSDGTYEIDGQVYYVGKNLANIKQYAQYGGVGMTIYYPQDSFAISNADSIAKAKALIDELKEVGITKTILQDARINYLSLIEKPIVGAGCQFETEDELDQYVYECVKDYADYPGVYGIQLGDEPKYVCLDAYSAMYKSIKRINQKYGFNLHIQYNLNPLNVTQTVYENYYPAVDGTYDWNNIRYKWGIEDRFEAAVLRYTKYINDFLNAMEPDSIMYDDYPLLVDKNGDWKVSESYIPCLQIVAKAASDRGIAFYNVTQAFENNHDGSVHRRQMTEAGAKWLNNMLLGFGVKQIAYYTYYTRYQSTASGNESYVDGSSFVDYNGNPTDLYYTMKEILADNQIFAKTILQFDYQGSKHYKGSSVESNGNMISEITQSSVFAKLSSVSVDREYALITELYDDENANYMYMVMNITDPDATGEYTQNTTVTFSGYTHALVYRDGEFTEVTLSNGAMTVTAKPGEASFIIPYNN